MPQPPSGEQCSPEPQRAAEYVRAIGAFAKINFLAKVFSFTPLTQYILVPEDASFAGSVPEKRMMRRVAQIGGGKIFGSAAFVLEMVFALGERFKARHVPARAVEDIGFATHGWRLAKEVAA